MHRDDDRMVLCGRSILRIQSAVAVGGNVMATVLKHVIHRCCWYLEPPQAYDDAYMDQPIMAKFDRNTYCQGYWFVDEDGDVMFGFSECTEYEIAANVEAWCFLVDFE